MEYRDRHCRSAESGQSLQQLHSLAGLAQVGGGDQAVVAAAYYDGVIGGQFGSFICSMILS